MRSVIKAFLAALAKRRGPLRFVVAMMARRNRRRGDAGVAAVVLGEEGRVLLLEHVFWPRRRWGLPGGWVRSGENPADAVRREIGEELGLEASVERLLLDEETGGRRVVAYLCSADPRAPLCLSLEIVSTRWFPPGELPDDLLPFHRKAVEAAMRDT